MLALFAWAPHSHKDIHLFERVQMFGTKEGTRTIEQLRGQEQILSSHTMTA